MQWGLQECLADAQPDVGKIGVVAQAFPQVAPDLLESLVLTSIAILNLAPCHCAQEASGQHLHE